MQEYETEEQQIEAVKKWLKENTMSLVLGVGVGIAALFGWRSYVDYQQEHGIQASDMYLSVIQQVAAKNVDDENLENVKKLVTDYSDTPYAALASLAMAKYEFEKNNTDEAVAKIQWVVANADDAEIQHVARLRLVRIMLRQKKYDEAEKWLSVEQTAAFSPRYEELRGDLYVAKGEIELARVAYDKAIAASGNKANQWLKLKRRDLGGPEFSEVLAEKPPA